jgi:predicted phage terminase large subunit-like protein
VQAAFQGVLEVFWHVVVPEKLVWNWHLDYLCDELQLMAERVFANKKKLYDLIINISPGSSKSTIASIMFPAWCWIRMASCRIISASYSYAIAIDLSRKSRDIIQSDLFKKCFPGLDLREDQNAKGFFVNTSGGERYAIGMDGGVTGKHAHIIVVDDPLNPKQAASEADLKAANIWMEETLPSRKVDRLLTPTILIMQRLHEYDPTGVRLSKKTLKVKHICLPSELTDNVQPVECRERYVNGLMDPKRLSYEALREAEAQGSFVYASQYLQTPIPRGGAMFDTEQVSVGIPTEKMVALVRYWDKAATQDGGTYTAGVKVGKDRTGRYWIIDVVRGQWNSGNREKVMRATAERDGRMVVVYVEQEPGSGGKESAEGTVRNLAGFIVKKHKVGKSEGDKIARADAFSSQVNIGNVSVVKGSWNETYFEEMKFFPNSRFKDQIDASSGGFNVVAATRRYIGPARSKQRQLLRMMQSSNTEKLLKN